MKSHLKHLTIITICLLILSHLSLPLSANESSSKVFKAGVAEVDVTPVVFPVIVNGYFTERKTSHVSERLMSRAIVLDDGNIRIALVVVDNLMIKRNLLDDVKQMAEEVTGIPENRILISSTHTHSAASAMGCLGSRVDKNYIQFLPGQIAKSIIQANKNLVPAKIGWSSIQDYKHNHCRRWIYRADEKWVDPFGERTVRAHMHPGHLNPKTIGPSGPVDHGFSLLAIQSLDGKLMSVMGNYAFHYYNSVPISSDACGLFGGKFKNLLKKENIHPGYVGILSQGTSGDIGFMNYSIPPQKRSLELYSIAMAENAIACLKAIKFQDWVPLAMAEQKLKFQRRLPDEKRLKWAKDRISNLNGKHPTKRPDIYAHETMIIHNEPEVEIKLQAIRIGDLGITALPHEVYSITGIKLKTQSPFKSTFNIELANGAQGYIPPPEQHQLGGYTTWPARTAGLEVQAEPQIVETLLTLLEKVAGKPRRKIEPAKTPYSQAVLNSKPVSYWNFDELAHYLAIDQLNNHPGTYESGVARFLPGPNGKGISTGLHGNRSAHFAGGRMKTEYKELGDTYSVEFWFWNGLPHNVRPVTGYFFSRGKNGDSTAAGDHLGIGGTYRNRAPGKLIFFNGNKANEMLMGKTDLKLKTWNHVILVRKGKQITVYLNGDETPEISDETKITYPSNSSDIFFGGRNDNFALFEGKLDEVALYNRALSSKEAANHFKVSGMPKPKPGKPTKVVIKKPKIVELESKALSPKDSHAAIRIREGYEVELVVSEPLVKDPVSIAWDAQGRLWVAEMADYPLGMDGRGKPGGRIRVLTDTNNDGKYDHSTIFIEGVSFPNGVLPWKDGVLITAAPDIIYALDTNGDGKADKKEVLYTGFNPGNQQLRVNGLRWGLDNWIYCASGSHNSNYGSGSKIKSTKTGVSTSLGSRDFRIHPTTGRIDPESGPSQFGRNRDDWGNWFGSMNSHPLWHYVLKDRYTRRNPHIAPPDPRNQLILPRNPKVYPAKAPQKRFHSFKQSGRFTSACSAMIYRDQSLFTNNEIQHGFTCEPFHNLVQHFLVKDDGATFQASRSPQEPKYDFFASTDRWSRPVMTTTGPDGALWVVDIYRYMIEHPQWLTPEGREELKPYYRHGDNRGRIYRIFPKEKKPGRIPNLKKLSNQELVKQLETSNGVQRDLIQETLISRADQSVNVPLINVLKNSSQPLARLHALCTLDGLAVITPEILTLALKDKHPGIQKQAIRIAEPYLPNYPKVLEIILQLTKSSNSKVRQQLAYSLGEWKNDKCAKALAELLIQDQSDIYVTAACMSSISNHNIGSVLNTVLLKNDKNNQILNQLIEQSIALKNKSATLNALNYVLKPQNKISFSSQFNFLASVFKALKMNHITIESLLKNPQFDHTLLNKIQSLTKIAVQTITNPESDESLRISAIPLMGQFNTGRQEQIQLLAEMISPQTSPKIQSASIRFLVSFSNPEIADLLLENWKSHGPSVRSQILKSLLSRGSWLDTLLNKIEQGDIALSDIDAVARQTLVSSKNKKVQARAKAIFKSAGNSDRKKIVAKYHSALKLTGNPAKGKIFFKEKCSTCHKLENVGHDIGPNIASLTDKRPETFLTAILNPSASVDTKYMTYSVITEDGRTFSGILSAETGNSITLVMQENKKQVILRSHIDEIQSTGKSMMPDGLEKDVTPQTLADLISYIRLDRLK